MPAVGVRALKQQASQIIRDVEEQGVRYQITRHGRVVAQLVPAPASPASSDAASAHDAAVWAELDQLAEEISAGWPGGVSATEAVAEGRREL